MISNSHNFMPPEVNPNDFNPNSGRQFLYLRTRKRINDMGFSKRDAFFMGEFETPFPVYILQREDYLATSDVRDIMHNKPIL